MTKGTVVLMDLNTVAPDGVKLECASHSITNSRLLDYVRAMNLLGRIVVVYVDDEDPSGAPLLRFASLPEKL